VQHIGRIPLDAIESIHTILKHLPHKNFNLFWNYNCPMQKKPRQQEKEKGWTRREKGMARESS